MENEITLLDEKTLGELDACRVPLPLDDDHNILAPSEMRQWIAQRQTEGVYLGIGIGIGLCSVKAALPHGEFAAWLENVGMAGSSARRYMGAARSFAAYSANTKKEVRQLSGRKVELLSKHPAHIIDELFEEGAFDGIEEMSPKEIKEILRLNEAKNKAEVQRDQAIEQLKQATEAPSLPRRSLLVDAMREESSFESSVIVHALDQLSQMLERAQTDPQFNALPKAEIDLALETLLININGALAHAAQLAKKNLNLPEDMPAIVFSHHLSDEEINTHIERCDAMRITAENELDRREAARKNERNKGRRGRPFKVSKA